MPTDDPNAASVTVNRPKKTHSKKTDWDGKSDKLNHSRKTAFKRTLAEIEDDDEDWQAYQSR